MRSSPDLDTLEAVLLRSRAAERLEAALRARAAQSARGATLAAWTDLRARETRLARRANAAFAAVAAGRAIVRRSPRPRAIDAPGWGHAEAYLALGRELQAAAIMLGARNWIEKSLIAAPDYKAAQKQLAALAHADGAPRSARRGAEPGIIRAR